jgi:two-component system sensor histidine kinase/response regulator
MDTLYHHSDKRSGKDILVIDDTPDNLRFLSSLLTEAGYTVRKVINGELGLEAAKLQPPDLILLDIMMPGINGYEVCQQMKINDRTRDVPIIFLSALDEELEKVQAFQIGGVDYVTKPFQVVEVLARIETHLKLSKLQLELQQKNLQLQQEIDFRTAAESALQLLNQGLEAHIQARTAKLKAENNELLCQQAEFQTALEQEKQANFIQAQILDALINDSQPSLMHIKRSLDRLQNSSLAASDHQAFLQTISNHIQHIEQLITKAASTVQTNNTVLPFQPVSLNLTQFCRNFVNQWQLPENSPHSLNFVSQGHSPSQVFADPKLLQQLLTQLVANAIRFSPEGGNIFVELIYEPSEAQLRIQDEGIGIPLKECERIFDRLYCASNAEKWAGSGLGLAFVKQIVLLHQGKIFAESRLNQGTTITVLLPI